MKLTDIREFRDLVAYAFWGFVSFVLGLASLYIFYNLFSVTYWLAVPLSVAVNLVAHYSACHFLVFANRAHAFNVGLMIFAVIGIGEILIITGLVTLLVEYAGAHVYWARIGAGTIAAVAGFWANGHYNFKVL